MQIIVFQYVTCNLPVIKFFPLRSNFKDFEDQMVTSALLRVCINADLYVEYLFIFCRIEFRKYVFVDVSCNIKCDKSFLFNQFCNNITRNQLFGKLFFVLHIFESVYFFLIFLPSP